MFRVRVISRAAGKLRNYDHRVYRDFERVP